MLDNIYLYSPIIKRKEYPHIFEYQKTSSLFNENYTFYFKSHRFSRKIPVRGWLHDCFICESLTTHTINLEYKKDKFNFYVCGNCKNEFNRRDYKIRREFYSKYFVYRDINLLY